MPERFIILRTPWSVCCACCYGRKTEMVVGLIHDKYVHVPIEIAVSERKIIDTKSQFWNNVIQATGQPSNMKNCCELGTED